MYKMAQLKEAEVRGAVAALVDNGVLPIDSPMQFEKVAAETADMLGYSYDINDLANAAGYALNKVAEEEDAQLALGQLTLQKVAGDLSDDEFDYYAASIVKEAGLGQDVADWITDKFNRRKDKGLAGLVGDKAKDFGKGYVNALKFKDLREGAKTRWTPKNGLFTYKKDYGRMAKGLAKSLGAYAPIAAAAGAVGYGTYKNLRSK